MNAVSSADPADGAKVIRLVRATLAGPVIEVLRETMPELARVPDDASYDRVIGSIYLLNRTFRTFRDERDRFRHLLIDSDGRVVEDDTTPLSCGRSLDQVVAMVVRTAARRYFRQHLGGPEVVVIPDDKTGLLERIGLKAARPVPMSSPPKPVEAAEELYDAIKDYLLYEWQVPLVPTYATMSLDHARTLGSRLLDCDSATKLARALGFPVHAETLALLSGEKTRPTEVRPASPSLAPTPTQADAPVSDSAPVMAPPPEPAAAKFEGPKGKALISLIVSHDGKRLRGTSFADVLLQPEVRSLLKNGGITLHLTNILSAVGAEAAKALVGHLGLGMEQLAVLLLSAHEIVGDSVFLRLFGPNAEPAVLDRFVLRARNAGICTSSGLTEMNGFVTSVFTRPVAPKGR